MPQATRCATAWSSAGCCRPRRWALEYEITPLGRTLQPPFKALYAWTMEQMPEVEAARRAFDARSR